MIDKELADYIRKAAYTYEAITAQTVCEFMTKLARCINYNEAFSASPTEIYNDLCRELGLLDKKEKSEVVD